MVILDIMLPGKDGLTLCRDLRAIRMIPIIMLTGKGEEADRVLVAGNGADDYVSKPSAPGNWSPGLKRCCAAPRLLMLQPTGS